MCYHLEEGPLQVFTVAKNNNGVKKQGAEQSMPQPPPSTEALRVKRQRRAERVPNPPQDQGTQPGGMSGEHLRSSVQCLQQGTIWGSKVDRAGPHNCLRGSSLQRLLGKI